MRLYASYSVTVEEVEGWLADIKAGNPLNIEVDVDDFEVDYVAVELTINPVEKSVFDLPPTPGGAT